MKKKSIIFDMDGVIFDTERIYMNIWIDVYKRHGYKMDKSIYTKLIGLGRKDIYPILEDIYGTEFDCLKMFAECDSELKKIINSEKVPLKIGALEIFDYLKKSGYRMAIATSSPKEKLNMQLKIHNLHNTFDEIICADDVSQSKPNPEIFLKAASKLDSKCSECIVIEDSKAGILAAHNGNIDCIHVEDLVKADDEVIKYSLVQLKNLIEVKDFIKKHIYH